MSEPTTTHRRLEAWLDPLTVRTRQPEIAWLAAVHGMDGPPEVAAAALVGAIERSVAERSVIRKRSDGLRSAAAQLDGAPLQGLLRRHIEQTVTDGWERWRDLRALDRWLDLDALLEREAERSDAIGARLEVALKLVLGVIDDTGGAIGPSDPATPPISPEIRAVRRAAGVVTPAPVSRAALPVGRLRLGVAPTEIRSSRRMGRVPLRQTSPNAGPGAERSGSATPCQR